MILVHLVEFGVRLLAGAGGGYLAVLTTATFMPRQRISESAPTKPRFAVIVPAHNEEHTIPNTLRSLDGLDYPSERYGVFVVADNCSDSTAEVACRFGCTVWERVEPERRAKGYALSWAFERISEDYDAVVVIDADTKVDPGLLDWFARAYEPSVALQSLNLQAVGVSVSSVASYLASALQNYLKPLGRENLGFSAGLGGNGMCIPRNILNEVPWRRFGLAEDVEYHVDLVLAGAKVRFVPEARVYATAPSNLGGLRSQRLRWERGRVEALKRFAGPLLVRSVRERDAASLETLIAIAAPPLNLTTSASFGCLTLGVIRRSAASLAVGVLGLVAVAYAGCRALWMVRAPTKVFAYLPFLPLFIAWRTYISVRSLLQGVSKGWVRTERSGGELD